ncbi:MULTISPECIES: DUF3099 domain-containing protein [unclassified Yimella]|uniref:DUF3099 domain-containing protein n=1 Tax=unclassified Yimella TaxID=2649892 RepID=UPI00101BBDEB|nr:MULTISPECIES: DUF3099 domain-containing protein [unclassified Yimella]MCG8655266.1 DUF3099 domain-containing protein [Yimella sp. NH-Cas1]RYG77813.1 DUF3099 domain-containing protein [Yimella sp. RIT 621]
MARRTLPHDEVPSATNLPKPVKDDRDTRIRNYLISMSLRTVCFVLAVVLWGPLRWASVICMVGAVLLPYFAVVLANATNKRRIDVLGSVRPSDPISHLDKPK